MSRLWIPRGGEMRDAAIEQALLQDDVDIWRLWRRLGGINGLGIGAGDPATPFDGTSSSSSSSSGSSDTSDNLCSPEGCDRDTTFTVVVSGVVGTCDTQFNRTWTLTRYTGVGASACEWRSQCETPGDCTTSGATWKSWWCRFVLADVGSSEDVWALIFRRSTATDCTGGTEIANYQVGVSSMNCIGDTTLTKISSSHGTWPSSFTITGS